MADQRKITLRPFHASPNTIILRDLPVANPNPTNKIILRTLHATPNTIILLDPADFGVAIGFPTQYSGLRFFKSTVQELCLVATADAPAGDQWRVQKNGTTYAVYLVATSDPNASHVRVWADGAVKAARLKT